MTDDTATTLYFGRLTAMTFSPRLQENIGYAMVPVVHSALGTPLTTATPNGDQDATIVRRPFVDPKKDIPKS